MIDQEWNSVHIFSRRTFPESRSEVFLSNHIHISSVRMPIVTLGTDLTSEAVTR